MTGWKMKIEQMSNETSESLRLKNHVKVTKCATLEAK